MDYMETKNDKGAISVSATIPIKSSSNIIYEALKNKIQQLFNKEGKYSISLNYDKMIQQYDYMLDTADKINSLTPDQLLQLQEQIIKLENAKRMKELEEGLNKCSDKTVIGPVLMAFNKLIEEGIHDSKKIIDAVIDLTNHPQFKGYQAGDSSHFNSSSNTINLDHTAIDLARSNIIIHETLHALQQYTSENAEIKVPEEYLNVRDFWVDLRLTPEKINEFYQQYRGMYDKMIENVKNKYPNVFEKYKNNKPRNLDELKEFTDLVASINPFEIDEDYMDFEAISEMISGIFGGNSRITNKYKVNGVPGHSGGYYTGFFDEIKDGRMDFMEASVEFARLKLFNRTHALSVIKNLFGKEYYNMLDAEYNRMIKNLDMVKKVTMKNSSEKKEEKKSFDKPSIEDAKLGRDTLKENVLTAGQKKQEYVELSKQNKQLVLTNNNQKSGFASLFLLALITGFLAGIGTMIIYLMIR